MKLNFIYLFLITIIIVSCNKSYEYSEIKEKNGGLRVEKKIIKEENDTLAFLEAIKLFNITKTAEKTVNKIAAKDIAEHTTDFYLYNDKGEDISKLEFHNKENRIKEIENRFILNEEKTKKEEQTNDEYKRLNDERVKKLMKYFSTNKDEFSTKGVSVIKPLNTPKFIYQNAIFCYIGLINEKPTDFRFRVQYFSDDWLFIKKLQFNIDGKAYEYIPNSVERDHNQDIWEWFDESITTTSDVELLKALANCKKAKVKFIGSQYYDVRNISEKDILSIKRTLELYEALGGKL